MELIEVGSKVGRQKFDLKIPKKSWKEKGDQKFFPFFFHFSFPIVYILIPL